MTRAAAPLFRALAMSVGGAPAWAADGIDCVYEASDPATRQSVMDIYGGNRSAGETVRSRLAELSTACSTQHRWSAEATRLASNFTVARILYEGLRSNAPVDADQLRRVESMLDAIDPAAFERWATGGMTPADGEDVARRMSEAGLPVDQRTGRFVGQYAVVRYQMRRMQAQFATL